ncbi:MAG TPA: hypothetical protein VH593_29135 [Ktedonobacteraceae bacterium]
MLENSERTQREEKLQIVIIQLCPLPFREQMNPMLAMALSMLPDDKLEELEHDMIGIPEEVAEGNLERLIAVGQKFGVDTNVAALALAPKDGSG